MKEEEEEEEEEEEDHIQECNNLPCVIRATK